ncbi:isochorismatase family protein [Mycobacterium sp. HUMS_1102779]|uniref:isochorismatase family protein n=1 Tax=Mycobacterium sp. HUMS_1102779 TaxID=3383487 RepID=UPI0038998646
MSPSPLTPEDPATMAVLCIECQQGVLGPQSVLPALATDVGGLVPVLGRLLDAARGAGVHVVHATYAGPLAGSSPTGTARIWRALGPATAGWTPECPEAQVIPGLLGATDFVLPRRHGLFPTLGTELLPLLRDLGVRTVVLTGVSLNLALPITAGHVSQAGFNLVVPRDAVGGTPMGYAEQVLDNTIGFLARLTTVDDLVAEWARHS